MSNTNAFLAQKQNKKKFQCCKKTTCAVMLKGQVHHFKSGKKENSVAIKEPLDTQPALEEQALLTGHRWLEYRPL